MDPFGISALLGGGAAAANIGGGILGYFLSRGDYKRAQEEMAKIVAEYEAIGVPSIEAQQIVLEPYKQQGILTPEMEQLVTLGDSQMGGISTDPALRESQMNALNELERVGEGGLRLSDQAAYEKVLGETGAQNRGAQEAIVQNMKERGAYGSGNELATRLMAQQESANRAHGEGLNIAASAADRALSAIMQGGELGGAIRGQDWAEKESVAKAQDAIAAFNAQNQQGLYGRNTERRNDAQAMNLGSSQQIANANTDLRNQGQIHNKGLYQQEFENKLSKQDGLSGARQGLAGSYADRGRRTADMVAGIGKGLGEGLTGVGDYLLKKKKKPGGLSGE